MKRIFGVLAIGAFAFASCKTNTQEAAVIAAQQNTIDSIKTEMARKQIVDSMNEVAKLQYTVPVTAAAAPVREVRTVYKAPRKRRASNTNTAAVAQQQEYPVQQASYPVYSQPQAPAYPAQAPMPTETPKKGWSAKAKGAAIGAGAGAVAGAIINKDNRAKGAIIGGVAGAAGGLGIGAIIDRKKGR